MSRTGERPRPDGAPVRTSRIGLALRIAVGVILIIVAWRVSVDVRAYVEMELMPDSVGIRRGVIALAFLAMILLLALPFVPGAEIGYLLLTALGGAAAPLVWGACVAALTLAFLVGRAVPARVTCAWLRRFGLRRAAALVERLDGAAPREDVMVSTAPGRVSAMLARHRHLALALTLNLPGNILLGGGGGLSLAAGMSRTMSLTGFVVTVGLACLPVPATFLLLDLNAAR